MEKENLEKKIKEREKISKVVMNKVTLAKNTSQKDILQDGKKGDTLIKENNYLSRDYRKERAEAKNQAIENLKNNFKLPIGDKKADNYEKMNNNLIKSGLKPGH